MDEPACTCGFRPTDDYHLTDHLGEVFIPADDLDPDGQLHAEAARAATAAAPHCPPAAAWPAVAVIGRPTAPPSTPTSLSAFSPPDAIGPDGRKHLPAS